MRPLLDIRPRPPAHLLCAGPLLMLAAVSVGCAEASVPVRASWLLSDGQSCAGSGVAEVEVAVTSALRASSRFACEDGFAPDFVELGVFEPGVVHIEVVALSSDEVVLYRAESLADLRGDGTDALMQLEPVEPETDP